MQVIAIFDIGKTNKKLFLFNQDYELVWETATQFAETTDEDGDPCEDLEQLDNWVKNTWQTVQQLPQFEIKALNFSAYGASFVSLDATGEAFTPLYNYLKPYSEALQKQFYDTYGGEELVATETASPVLGNLNSGMQLYRLKYEKPGVFAQIQYSLHLPQYLSFLLSGQYASDITSVGCHTNLWNFQTKQYHNWVVQEGIADKLPPIRSQEPYLIDNQYIGIGLHDSSAALIPYLSTFTEPFVLISTGTWCVSMNPFNNIPLSFEELQQDCLCYLSYQAQPVKASRLFAGYEHEQSTKQLAERFGVAQDHYKTITFNENLIQHPHQSTYEAAYHSLMTKIVEQQIVSTNLVLQNTQVKQIFVDGGFSKNDIYMKLMAKAFPAQAVFAASVAQATALGAALALHAYWNKKPVGELINLKKY